jgi:hypothetical protein
MPAHLRVWVCVWVRREGSGPEKEGWWLVRYGRGETKGRLCCREGGKEREGQRRISFPLLLALFSLSLSLASHATGCRSLSRSCRRHTPAWLILRTPLSAGTKNAWIHDAWRRGARTDLVLSDLRCAPRSSLPAAAWLDRTFWTQRERGWVGWLQQAELRQSDLLPTMPHAPDAFWWALDFLCLPALSLYYTESGENLDSFLHMFFLSFFLIILSFSPGDFSSDHQSASASQSIPTANFLYPPGPLCDLTCTILDTGRHRRGETKKKTPQRGQAAGSGQQQQQENSEMGATRQKEGNRALGSFGVVFWSLTFPFGISFTLIFSTHTLFHPSSCGRGAI